MKVYLATAGSYSDYRVRQVFARREDAEAYGLADDVEEYDLQESPVEVRTWYTLRWYITKPDGPADSRSVGNPWESSELRDFDGRPNNLQHSTYYNGDVLLVEGWDLNGVRKVYSEQRAQHIAKREGIA